MQVYLSGPISDTSFDDASNWREYATKKLGDAGFVVRDPLRGKSFLSNQLTPGNTSEIDRDDYEKLGNPLLSDKALFRRDKLDVISSDIILCNFSEAKKASIGSIFELSLAEDHKKLAVIVLNKVVEEDAHNHPFVRESGVIFYSFEDALDYIISCNVKGVK
ncbi:hypothetical protein LCGC14_2652570 [marine sediment metagenome]|uniref:Nucleoside 2-deoxyribosyltransferase n=1 Tax=marine sediment metagenome TaxID=412755 RepID=A0A0F9CLF6_9ZZZZ